MAWYWIILIVVGYFVMGSITAWSIVKFLDSSSSDETSLAIGIIFWPILSPLLVVVITLLITRLIKKLL